jgi:hypothetical protein
MGLKRLMERGFHLEAVLYKFILEGDKMVA